MALDEQPEHLPEYGVTAEFYDLLQAERDLRRVTRLYRDLVGEAKVAVLDVGAGTGVVTAMLLRRTGVLVHAVEPALPMRTALLSRLSAMGADQRARVTVHACDLQSSGLREAADAAVCHNLVAGLEPAGRRALWPALRRALRPGALLAVETPPSAVPTTTRTSSLPRVRLGQDVYGARVVTGPDRGRISARFEYHVHRDGREIRRHVETFTLWPLTAGELGRELKSAGFATKSVHEGVLLAHRVERIGD